MIFKIKHASPYMSPYRDQIKMITRLIKTTLPLEGALQIRH